MLKKLRIILKDKSGVSFPLVIGVTLSLLLIFCGVSEYFRLQIMLPVSGMQWRMPSFYGK
mgnify:CR=1 FL=1